MKKIIFAISLLAITGTLSFAQDKTTSTPAVQTQVGRDQMNEKGKAYAEKEVSRLEKPLKLDDKQKQAVYSISLKWNLMDQMGNMPKGKVQEMKESQLKTTLTPEQFAKYKALTK